jgi:hypothetical protein
MDLSMPDRVLPFSNLMESISITCGSQYIPLLLNFFSSTVSTRAEVPGGLQHIFKITTEVVAYFLRHHIGIGYLRTLYTIIHIVLPHLRKAIVVFMILIVGYFIPDP